MPPPDPKLDLSRAVELLERGHQPFDNLDQYLAWDHDVGAFLSRIRAEATAEPAAIWLKAGDADPTGGVDAPSFRPTSGCCPFVRSGGLHGEDCSDQGRGACTVDIGQVTAAGKAQPPLLTRTELTGEERAALEARIEELQHCCDKAVFNRGKLDLIDGLVEELFQWLERQRLRIQGGESEPSAALCMLVASQFVLRFRETYDAVTIELARRAAARKESKS